VQKTYLNAALTGFGFVGFLGSVVVRTLEMAGLVETALWLHGLTDQGAMASVNWTAISFDIFCVCTAALILINFTSARQAYRNWQKSRRHSFMSAHAALMWLCYWTLLGDAWLPAHKEEDGLEALKALGRKGKLTFMGCAVDDHSLKKISPAQFSDAHLEIYEANKSHGRALALVSAAKNPAPSITGLVVDQGQVLKLWQRNSRPEQFLGWAR
jgi:hypothetical protein